MSLLKLIDLISLNCFQIKSTTECFECEISYHPLKRDKFILEESWLQRVLCQFDVHQEEFSWSALQKVFFFL